MASTTEPNMIDDTLLEAEEKMDKAVSVAKEDFSIIRTGRAHPGMFSKVTVDYYGSPSRPRGTRPRTAGSRSGTSGATPRKP
jgi:hypothetical protein